VNVNLTLQRFARQAEQMWLKPEQSTRGIRVLVARLYRVHRAVVVGDLVYWVERLQEEQPEVFDAIQWSFAGVREFQEPREYVRRKRTLPGIGAAEAGRGTQHQPTAPEFRRIASRLLPKPARAVTAALATE